jgi:hypothetical protein
MFYSEGLAVAHFNRRDMIKALPVAGNFRHQNKVFLLHSGRPSLGSLKQNPIRFCFPRGLLFEL